MWGDILRFVVRAVPRQHNNEKEIQTDFGKDVDRLSLIHIYRERTVSPFLWRTRMDIWDFPDIKRCPSPIPWTRRMP